MKTLFSRFAKANAVSRPEGLHSIRHSGWPEHGSVPKAEQKPEEIAAKLRQVDALVSQGHPVTEAIHLVGVPPFSYYRWRKEAEALRNIQVKRLQQLEQENERLRKAVSSLVVEKLTPKEAAA